MRFVGTAGRVDKFRAKTTTESSNLSKKAKRFLKKKQRIEEELSRPSTLDELRKK